MQRELIQDLLAYFYADNGIVASTQSERLQRVFNVLADLFVRFVLQKNTWNTEIIEFHPCHMPGIILVVEYERQVTGMGPNYWERQRMRVQCP